jgi:hypothetical protein
MSDNTHYGKGIPITSGFDLGAKSPLDSRMVVANFEELQLHVDGNRAYEGMLVYVNSEKKLYVYNGSDWEELTTSVDADSPIFDVVDNLESTATNAPLSANQGRVLKETINDVEDKLEETISNVEDKLEQLIEDGVSGGNANIHVGTEPPKDTTYMWIDTSAPYNLDITTYEGRTRLKYIEMLNLVSNKLNSLSYKVSVIENNINKISSDNSIKMNEFKAQLSSLRNQISTISLNVASTLVGLQSDGSLSELKATSKQLRKQMKSVLYGLADLNCEVLVVLDGQTEFVKPNNPNNPDNPSTGSGSALSTEDGRILLTEDGLSILLDGAISSDILADAILTEMGHVILTENEKQILKG